MSVCVDHSKNYLAISYFKVLCFQNLLQLIIVLSKSEDNNERLLFTLSKHGRFGLVSFESNSKESRKLRGKLCASAKKQVTSDQVRVRVLYLIKSQGCKLIGPPYTAASWLDTEEPTLDIWEEVLKLRVSVSFYNKHWSIFYLDIVV